MQTLLTDLCEVKDIPALRHSLLQAGDRLGFQYMGVVYSRRSDEGKKFETWVHNYPGNWLENLPVDAGQDPVLKTLQTRPGSLAWDNRIYESVGMGGFYESARSHGFCSGIDAARWLPGDKRVVVSLCRDRLSHPDELPRQVDQLRLASDLIVGALLPLLDQRTEVEHQLTPQQLAILGYTLDGRSLRDIADLLGIGDATAEHLAAEVALILGVNNERQAAMRAAKLGFVH